MESETINEITSVCSNYTMTSYERLLTNINTTQHILDNNVDGCFIEIGVWQGGSILSAIKTLEVNNDFSREVHLYDTFEGMTESTEKDIDLHNTTASDVITNNEWFKCISSLDEVKSNIYNNTKYPKDKIFFHQGDICQTKVIPQKIAFLRLDTDWYESTKFELDNFYDSVQPNGVVIIDDYGHWQGCRRAVDEFILNHPTIEIKQIDYTGIYFIKK